MSANRTWLDSAITLAIAFCLGGIVGLQIARVTVGASAEPAAAPVIHVHPTIHVQAPPAPVVSIEAPHVVPPAVVVNVPKQEAPQVWNVMPLPVGGGGVHGNPSSTPAAPPAEVLNEALDRAQWGALLPGPKR